MKPPAADAPAADNGFDDEPPTEGIDPELSSTLDEVGALHDAPPWEQSTTPTDTALTDREQQILAFERKWWKHAGAKEQAIRDAFDLSATRYYQLLNGLLDNPAALAADPVLIGRLRRLRSARARGRRR
ncbi:Protein of unknown function [Micromonospora pattaloongensis]|uniref:DUF3263 domain-containing protein n=1 Tax=Micromonospora pattaloongensis TaxID=405436 RepID=A0A1H3H1N0_9ACTN|nr:DUF3263 domain-containing protein [Micromonospora pattaloongensis]SDY09287.1 Protein of unknown function [Micromonospora pattaloongensis]